jgi:xanthine dehydrogenase accessory factor
MNDIGQILPLWRELERTGVNYVLATVVAVEGSSYRKPGALMLLSQDGRRAGTVSGGCLEAEVARRAWWLTASGPVVERYSTQNDEDERPYGSGCGGVVWLLLERKETSGPLMACLESAFSNRVPIGVATVLDGPHIGRRRATSSPDTAPQTPDSDLADAEPFGRDLAYVAQLAYDGRVSFERTLTLGGAPTRVRADYRPARSGLWIFGAGDDARPLVQLAHGLGWFAAIGDGRAHLATRERFPEADDLRVLPISDLPGGTQSYFSLRPSDAAVLMTHSFDQDSRILASLLRRDTLPAYLGVLGPQRRTRELLAEAARLLQLPPSEDRVENWLARMHAPTGLDLGGETPAAIALSILAEIQLTLAAATGQALRTVRADHEIAARC